MRVHTNMFLALSLLLILSFASTNEFKNIATTNELKKKTQLNNFVPTTPKRSSMKSTKVELYKNRNRVEFFTKFLFCVTHKNIKKSLLSFLYLAEILQLYKLLQNFKHQPNMEKWLDLFHKQSIFTFPDCTFRTILFRPSFHTPNRYILYDQKTKDARLRKYEDALFKIGNCDSCYRDGKHLILYKEIDSPNGISFLLAETENKFCLLEKEFHTPIVWGLKPWSEEKGYLPYIFQTLALAPKEKFCFAIRYVFTKPFVYYLKICSQFFRTEERKAIFIGRLPINIFSIIFGELFLPKVFDYPDSSVMLYFNFLIKTSWTCFFMSFVFDRIWPQILHPYFHLKPVDFNFFEIQPQSKMFALPFLMKIPKGVRPSNTTVIFAGILMIISTFFLIADLAIYPDHWVA